MATRAIKSRRELGSIYTPPDVARKIVRDCLDARAAAVSATEHLPGRATCRVLDPACGDGAFLLQVFDELCCMQDVPAGALAEGGMNAGAQRRLGLVRDYIFGVDIDQPAVQALRLELLARINGTGEVAAQAAAVVEANIRWGDSLSGPDYTRHRAFALNSCGRPRRQKGEKGKGRSAFVRHVNSFEASDHHGVSSPPLTEETISLAAPAIDWQRDFPEAAASGGFDVIVG